MAAKIVKTSFFGFLSGFFVRARAHQMSTTEAAKTDGKQLKTSRLLLHSEMITEKVVEVLFETQFV